MSRLPYQVDRDLLFQVLGTVALLVVALIEIALAQYPSFYGSTPLVMVMMTQLMMIYLPVALPLIAVVIAGLVFDLVQAAPIGYTTSILLLVMMVARFRRSVLIHADAGSVWYEFALVLLGLQVFSFAIVTFWSGDLPAIRPFISQYGITVLLFPLFNWAIAPIRFLDPVEGPA